jgi:hypothetical protein
MEVAEDTRDGGRKGARAGGGGSELARGRSVPSQGQPGERASGARESECVRGSEGIDASDRPVHIKKLSPFMKNKGQDNTYLFMFLSLYTFLKLYFILRRL